VTSSVRDLVVVIPGITGSVLTKHGRALWGRSPGVLRQILSDRADWIADLTLEADDPDGGALDDGVAARGLVRNVVYIPGLVTIGKGYSALTAAMKGALDLSDGPAGNLVEFAYDWRRDVRGVAHILDGRIKERLAEWKARTSIADTKVVIVAHSMGGLVGRYWGDVIDGWEHCRLLVTVATPHRGAPNAGLFLANGYRKLGVVLTDVMRSCTSVHQLVPRYEMILDGATWKRPGECSIANLSTAEVAHWRATARDKLHRELDDAWKTGQALVPIAGIGKVTAQAAELSAAGLVESAGRPPWYVPNIAQMEGDGTVPWVSVLPWQLGNDRTVRRSFPGEHGRLVNQPEVQSLIVGEILASQAAGTEHIRLAPVGEEVERLLTLDIAVPGIVEREEEAEVAVTVRQAGNALGAPAPRLVAQLLHDETGEPGQTVTLEMREEGPAWVTTTAFLPPGLWRLTAVPPAGMRADPGEAFVTIME
jgi:hypothetical protein